MSLEASDSFLADVSTALARVVVVRGFTRVLLDVVVLRTPRELALHRVSRTVGRATWPTHGTSVGACTSDNSFSETVWLALSPSRLSHLTMATPETPCYTVVTEDSSETPSTSDLRSALQKGSDEVKLDTLRKIIVATINGNPQVCLSHPDGWENC